MPRKKKRKAYCRHRTQKIRQPSSINNRREELAWMLLNTFSLRNGTAEYLEYIIEHPYLEHLLPLAARIMREQCGPDARILLDIVPDHGQDALIFSVESDASPAESTGLLDSMDERWHSSVTDIIDRIRFDLQAVR